MYQNEIKEEALEAIQSPTPSKFRYSIFEKADFDPLTFIPEDDNYDATAIARDILLKRNSADIIKISKSIASMIKIGDRLLHLLALNQIKSEQRTTVSLFDGRSLYLLHHYFDLKDLDIRGLVWGEVFATLVLMQAAEIKFTLIRKFEDDDLSQALKAQSIDHLSEMREGIIDSVARAECLYDKKITSKNIAKSGGKSKSKNTEELKMFVIELYEKGYRHLNNKRAGEAILKRLKADNNKLLLSSYAEDKQLIFAKWISQYNNGNLNLSIVF